MNGYTVAPAPWTLRARGWVILFSAPKDWLRTVAPAFTDSESGGGVGSLMFVDYQSSPVGAYQEVLVIPGWYRAYGRRPRRATITSIYVSSQESVIGGRANWGFPKEFADFHIRRSQGFWSVDESFCVERDGEVIAAAELQGRGPRFPVSSLFLPFPLLQVRDGKRYFTEFRGSGWGRLGTVASLRLEGAFIADVSWLRPRIVVRIDPFRITFPAALVSTIR